MTPAVVPIVKDLVLIGGGHSHVAVLKRFGMRPMPGVRITLIAKDALTPYSGMLPGHIAGHYTLDECHIDLRPLARFAGARLYHDEAIGLDLAAKRVLCRDHPGVDYDVVSIDIGSTPRAADIPGAADYAVPVKPIGEFVARWRALAERARTQPGLIRIATVGGGAGGVELTLAIQHRLHTLLATRADAAAQISFDLLTDQDDILLAYPARVRRSFSQTLQSRGIGVHRRARVVAVERGTLRCADGRTVAADEILWVTQAGTASWLAQSGLAADAGGFVSVDDCLRSISHPDVFAAGDCAAMTNYVLPKAGVYAVRQGPKLAENLRRALAGRTLRPYRPQTSFLSLISTGDAYAVGAKRFAVAEGRWVWNLKDWIDRRWMRKYTELPEMGEANHAVPVLAAGLASAEALKDISAIAMRCGGCGAKVGASVLSRVMAELKPHARPDILIGLDAPDDAAVVAIPPGKLVVQTVDYFRAIVDDPYLFGQIAANHALGDIFAMGAEPQSALAIVTIPYGIEAKIEATLRELMAGALKVLGEAETALVGGHTSEGAELALGFAITGLADANALLRKGGMRPGDRLILTKPLGTGTLFAADMRGKADGRWIEAALQTMLRSNRAAARTLLGHGAHAMTDVTGFGLLGHLVEMAKPSRMDVELDLDRVPLLPGALETAAKGILSSLQPQNVRLRRAVRNLEEASRDPRYALLFDPQTAGGLLAAVPQERAEAALAALRAQGYPDAAIIGRVVAQSDALEPIQILGAAA